MKVQPLREATSRLLPAIDTKGIVKEFTYFYFNGDTIDASNGSLLIRANLPEKTPVFAVEATTFHALLKSLSDEDVDIVVNEKTVEIKTATVKSELTLPTTSAKCNIDFNVDTWGPVPADLIHGLELSRYTACPDQTAGALTGVRIEKDVIISCDRWRISMFNLATAVELTATLPVDLIDQLIRFEKSITAYAIKGTTIYFKLDKAIIGAQLLGGDYPSDKLLNAISMTEGATELILTKETKAKIAAASARQNVIQEKIMEYDRMSKFTFTGSKVVLFAQNEIVGKIEEEIACAGNEKVAEFGFFINPVFLLKMFEETDNLTYQAEHSVASFIGRQFVHMVKTKAPGAA